MFTNHQLSILTNCTHLSMVLELLWTILQELLRCSAAEPVVGNPILVAGRRDKTDGNSPGKKMVLEDYGVIHVDHMLRML